MIDIRKVTNSLDILDRQAYVNKPIYTGNELFEAYTEVNQALIELARLQERETPMKVKINNEHGYFTCLKCSVDWGYSTEPNEYNYCPNCGQKLDWRKEND
jgi:transcription initiation factor IIE alpha subunit